MKAINVSTVQEPAGFEGLVTSSVEGIKNISLLVGGVHCAGCIQKIESGLHARPEVSAARLNYSTGRLNIAWSGPPEQANDFVHDIEALGYRVSPFSPDAEKQTAEDENRFLLLCLGVAGFAAGNIMLLSVGLWTTDTHTMGMATRELMHWMSALIAIPAVLFSGRPFFRSAYGALSKGHTNMDVPISVGLVLACGMSLFETINHGEHAYFDSAVMLMFFLLIGRVLDFRARRNARSAAIDLLQTFAGFANVMEDGRLRRIVIRDLREGMTISVAAGEKIPVDAIVETGTSTVDTSLITGETLPRAVQAGDQAYAGTLNLSAPVILRVAKAAENSLLADIVRLMEKAEQTQARYVRLADKAAQLYTPVVHALALLGFLFWWGAMGMDWHSALMISVTILIITCPCALGLAVPVVQVLATGLLMKHKILLKSGDALERLAVIDTVFLDKTGTLTLGKPELVGHSSQDHVRMAAALAAHSRHPLSRALVHAYDGPLPSLEGIEEFPGQGMEGHLRGKTIRIGRRSWCGDAKAESHDELELWLEIDGHPAALFLFADQLRKDAGKTISDLKSKGLHLALLSGDRAPIAMAVAKGCGIEDIHGDLSPVQKYDILQEFKARGHKILMVGDGLNDAPVLAGADVSMAPGTAIDMAQNAADIVFMGDELAPVNFVHSIARASQALVKQNFVIAALYNLVAIPLAFCGYVTPLVAAIAMSGSSLLVIANSFRLRGAA